MQTKITIHVSNRLNLGMFSYIDMTTIKDDVSLFIGKPVIDEQTGKTIGEVVDAQSVKGPIGQDAIEFTLELTQPLDVFAGAYSNTSIGSK